MIVWRDGDLVPGDSAVSAADRGFLVGDGAFETLLVQDGVAAFIAAHLGRLNAGAARLGMTLALDGESVRTAVDRLANADGVSGLAACRITVTRRGGARGLMPSPDAPTCITISLAQAAPPKRELALAVSSVARFSGAPTNKFKCIGAYGQNLLARLEAASAGADEAIMLNEFGRIACASAANTFLIAEKKIFTPSESEGAMPGIVRAILLEEAAALGTPVVIGPVTPELLEASTILLTNSLIGVARGCFDGGSRAGVLQVDDGGLEVQLASAYEARLQAEFSNERRGKLR
ncbi:MAG: aminotransferase class IV [Parvularculaceae bacterium]